MKHILIILAAFILVCPPVSKADTLIRKKDGQTQAGKKKTGKVPKSVYDELFKDKSKHTVSRGLMSVHLYQGKVYLEIPMELMEREFLINPVIKSSSDYKVSCTQAARPQYLLIEKTDSLVLFRTPGDHIRANDNDENHRQAFGLSQTVAVSKTFPIAGYTDDSTSVIFEATSYFSAANPAMLNLKGRRYDGLQVISKHSVQEKVSYADKVEAFENCISVTESSTLHLSISVLGLEHQSKPELAVSLQIVMVLLPESKMPSREANPRIGSGYVTYTDYRNVNHVKKGYFATRRNITPQKPVVFYLDTLLKPSWREAIRKSAEGWNRVFEKIGLGNPVVLREYNADPTFRADDPLSGTVSFINNDQTNVTAFNITDPRTGEILSTKIGIPRDFAFLVRRKGVYQMAGVDRRFRTYYIPDDLVCEGLTAYMLQAFGLALGLVPNHAGSFAYSPEQLRCPEFTRENGITASVMDDVLYNYLAQPGDKERGVALVISKPGICDEFALQYLYAPVSGDEEKILKQWALQHEGDPRYFYGQARTSAPYDPRCQQGDLSNDHFTAVDAITGHLKYIVENSHKWFEDDKIPNDYRYLFSDFVHMGFSNSLLTLLRYIGGVYMNIPDKNSSLPVYQPVPAELQRKAVMKILDCYQDLSWMDSNREFLFLAGANSGMSDWVYNSKSPVTNFILWLTRMGTGVEKSKEGKPYTQRDYLDDIENYIFGETQDGKPMSSNKTFEASLYISGLISVSPALKSIQETIKGSNKNILSEDCTLFPGGLVTFDYLIDTDAIGNNDANQSIEHAASLKFNTATGMENICYEKLADAHRLLQKARSLAIDEIERGKCDYLIMMINRVLL